MMLAVVADYKLMMRLNKDDWLVGVDDMLEESYEKGVKRDAGVNEVD